MRRPGLVILIITLLAGVSAYAQRDHNPKPQPPIGTAQQVYIQDDSGEGFMAFDLWSGAYTCRLCEYDYEFTGKGTVKTEGCLVTFRVVSENYSMTAYADMCEKRAICIISMRKMAGDSDSDSMQITMSDSDLRNSTLECGITSPPPPADLPLEVILQNDADGTFLFINAATGEFKFTYCGDGTTLSGTGKVSRAGSLLNFEAMTRLSTVVATVDLGANQGKAAVVMFESKGDKKLMEEFINDVNIADNVPACGAK